MDGTKAGAQDSCRALQHAGQRLAALPGQTHVQVKHQQVVHALVCLQCFRLKTLLACTRQQTISSCRIRSAAHRVYAAAVQVIKAYVDTLAICLIHLTSHLKFP